MLLPEGTVWEVRRGGHPDNGGGFVATVNGQPSIGRNYSLQEEPVLVVADAEVNHTVLTSSAGGFLPDMVNNIIWIPEGVTLYGGHYRVTAVPSAHELHLHRDAGFAAAVTVRVGGAAGGAPADHAFNRVLASVASGHVVNVQAGTYPLQGGLVSRAGGSLRHPVRLRGYNQTPGDAVAPTVLFDASGVAVDALRVTGAHWLIEHLLVEGRVASAASGFRLDGDGVVMHRCAARHTGGHGFEVGGRGSACIGCEADRFGQSAPAVGFRLTGSFAFATGCRAWRGNGAGFEWGAAAQVLAYCIAGSNSNAGFWSNVSAEDFPPWLLHCVAADNGDHGLLLANTQANRRVYVQNSIFEANGAHGIASDRDGKGAVTLIGCAFHGNGSGVIDDDTAVTALQAAVESSEPLLRAPAVGDYRLRPEAKLGSGAGWPGAFLDGGAAVGWSGHPDLGAVQQAVRPVINPLWMGAW